MTEPSRTGRGGGQEADPYQRLRTLDPVPEVQVPRERTVRLSSVTDIVSAVLIVLGFALGAVAAGIAGGTVPALATAGGGLVAVGLLLGLA